jgi:hypothetical protein
MQDLFAHATLDDVEPDLGRFLFLRALLEGGHNHVVRRELRRSIPQTALPARARNVRTLDFGPSSQLLADVDDVVVHVLSWKTSAQLTTAGSDPAAALAVLNEIRGRVPAISSDGKVDVAFTDEKGGSRYVELEARPWPALRDHYDAPVSRAIDELVRHEPAGEEARRLLLWHGAPGTGKTTAIRALLDAWREWADGVIVTDPEVLLNDGRYLRRTVLDNDEDDRWQLIVLEDAETLLHKGAGGRGMATLLNPCDGLLGQGLRCLFLITTNEPLAAVHPALVRPGRCLSRVEFGPLPAAQASRLLGRTVASAMSLAEIMAVKPVTSLVEAVNIGQYL